eukprot:scaffold104536_cov18-Prasinocladus_malaysianus.AAC.1
MNNQMLAGDEFLQERSMVRDVRSEALTARLVAVALLLCRSSRLVAMCVGCWALGCSMLQMHGGGVYPSEAWTLASQSAL